MLVTAISGLFFGEITHSILFAGTTVASGLAGAVLVASTMKLPAKESYTEALAFLISFWLIVPLVVAIPYVAGGFVENLPLAYFEAVSAFTTTGASTLDPDQIPKTLHVWRSLVQWAGGVAVATFAVVILAALNLKGTGVHRSLLFTYRRGELFSKLAGVTRVIAGVYATISFVCFIALIFAGTPIFESLCLALTSVSTGGLVPRGGPLDFYVSGIGVFALCFSCVLGAANVAVIWDFFKNHTLRDFLRLLGNVEHRTLVFIIGALIVIGSAYTDFRHLGTVIPESIFFVTSTGYDHHVIGLDMVPPVLLIAVALIGGSALSTTGGLKLIRILLLFRHLETDMDRMTHPSRVVPVTFKSRILPDSAFLSIWMYFFGYTLVFAAGIISFAAAGMEFPMAVTSSAAGVANMGPLLDATLPEYSYESFTGLQLSVMTVLMLLGRIEVLAAFAVLSPRMWRS